MKNNSHLVGVGGWLLLLTVGLTILGPLMGLGRLAGEFQAAEKMNPGLATSSQWLQYKEYSWWVAGIAAVISFCAGYRLWKIHAVESVRFAVLALWIIGPGATIAQAVVMVIVFGGRAATAGPKMVGGLLGSLIVASIWTAYLLRSRRVQNTYKRPLAPRAESETEGQP
ncbi:DUF2569 family protein [Arhodomonas aquaeolei]|uniref:DUF2569 family protein n=1 Tax=Arhodomonas aquaeolei TaxID=2369 RepID=UPI00036B8F3C|nr:DUF2569 family protein [Arhodomonas aquaeolei]